MTTPNNPIRQRLAGIMATALLALLAVSAHAQQGVPTPPGQISYQGYLTDANGAPLATNAPTNFDVFFRIYNSQNGTTANWGELQTVTVDRGYFSVLLGQGAPIGDSTPFTNDLTTVFSGGDASVRYIGIQVRNFNEIQPRLRLLSSPYALLASQSIALVGNTGTQVMTANGTNIGINGAAGNDSMDIHGNLGIFGNGTLNFGQGLSGQEQNAGKIGYEAFSSSALDIIGAGTTVATRKVKVWGALSTVGSLGVGTDTPATLLHVAGPGDVEVSVQSTDSSGHRWTIQSSGGGTPSLASTLQIVDRTASASRLTIDKNGQVGIGTTAPGATLEVNGTTIHDSYVGITGSQVLEFGRGVSGKEPNAGKIGYGTFSSGAALDIVGAGTGSNRKINMYAESGVSMNGGLSVSGNFSTSTLTLGGAGLSEGSLSILGATHINDYPIYFRTGTDHNHWMGYGNYFGSLPQIDGPWVFGNLGGMLGTSTGGQNWSMVWDYSGNTHARGNVYSGGWFYGVYGAALPSDRNIKTNFETINERDILAKVATLPITKWSFTNAPTQRRIGPMAQDFHAAFDGVGGLGDKMISITDEIGVALAAIKGLNAVVQDKETEIQALKLQVQALQAAVDRLGKPPGPSAPVTPVAPNAQ